MQTPLSALLRPLFAVMLAFCMLTLLVLAAPPCAAAVGPVISNVTYSPNPIPVKGGQITVTAQVTDAGAALSSVSVYETFPNSGQTYRTAPMALGSDGVTYTASVPVDLNTNSGANGERLYIVATDPAGNKTNSPVATQGYSSAAPTISNVTFSPNPLPIEGANVTVTAKVADPALGVSSVVLYETYPNSDQTNRTAPMALGSDGVTYTATVPVDLNPNNGAAGESLYIIATDPAGNATRYNVTTQGYSNQPPFGALPVLISGNPASPVLSPASVTAGGPELTLTLHGINFASGASVLFNGINLPTSTQTSTLITVNVPASLVAKPGSYTVTVLDPSPSGASNSVTLIVD